jgi:aspartate/methionine/tyrosine aminotransferase
MQSNTVASLALALALFENENKNQNMKLNDFKLERYFAKYEFSTKYLISSSDCDGYSLEYILSCASQNDLELWKNLHFGYTDSAGSLFLRETIATQYKTIGVDNVAVMSPGEANFILMNLILEKGDEVVCMSPAYQSLHQVAQDLGAEIKWWKPNEANMQFDVNDLEKLISPKTKLIIVNFPHNPTDFIPITLNGQIINLAARNNTVLFSDEMYHQLVDSPEYNIPAACDFYENAISCGEWQNRSALQVCVLLVATHNMDLFNKVLSFKDYLSICNNAAGEVLSKIALTNKEKFINPNIEKIRRNRKLFNEFANRHTGFISYNPPHAGSTAFVNLNIAGSALDYCENLVQKTGIMMVPSEMFGYGDKHVRIGFGRENFGEALTMWEQYISKY